SRLLFDRQNSGRPDVHSLPQSQRPMRAQSACSLPIRLKSSLQQPTRVPLHSIDYTEWIKKLTTRSLECAKPRSFRKSRHFRSPNSN
ncbi:hypothetical protein J6590_097368, partial [Homalodisca vitripennis]